MELNVLPGGSLWYIQTAPDSQRKTTEVPYIQTAAAIRLAPTTLQLPWAVWKNLKKERKGIGKKKNLDHLQIRHIQRRREGRSCGSGSHIREWTPRKFQPQMICSSPCFLCPEKSPPRNDSPFASMLPEILSMHHIASKTPFFIFERRQGINNN